MKWARGQAGRVAARLLRLLGVVLFTLIALVALGLGALAYRLDQGPLQIPYVASKIATLVSGEGVDVRIDQAALAWGGYRKGGGAPLYLQLSGVTASNAKRVTLATVPQARLLFPMRALFGASATVDVKGDNARLSGTNIPVSIAAFLHLGFGFQLRGAEITTTFGPGQLGPPGESLPITGGTMLLFFTPGNVVLQDGILNLTPAGRSAPLARVNGVAHRGKDWQARLNLTVDKVQAADLPFYWPPELGASARQWVLRNIQIGEARDASFALKLQAPRDLSAVALTDVKGSFQGSGLTLRWLPAATPITDLNGCLTVTNPDTVVITETSAALGKLALSNGSMTITGVSKKDQNSVVKLSLAGEVADAVALLNAPPLSLLNQAPSALRQASGTLQADVNASVPLENNLKLAQVQLTVDARLANFATPTPLTGLAMTAGALTLRATTTQISVAGTAQLAGQPAQLSVLAVFAAKPALRQFRLHTLLGTEFFDRYGLDASTAATDTVAGVVPVNIRVDATPEGDDAATLDADLTPARLGIPVLGWAKAVGQPGALHAQAVVDDAGDITVQNVSARGPDLNVEGAMQAQVLHLQKLDIGRTIAAGTVTFPGASRAPWEIDLAGPTLDIRAILSPQHPAAASTVAAQAEVAPGAERPAGPRWQSVLRFATLFLAAPPAPALRSLTLSGSGAGGEVLGLNAAAFSQAGQPVTLSIGAAPVANHRALHLQAGDGGDLLRVLGAYQNVRGGTLDLNAVYGGGGAFAGTVTLTKFQLLHAPALGKILQGLTIYGAPEAAATPGLAFSRLIAPFSIAHQVLSLSAARAYSASLGFTASGTIGLADGAANLDATVIPAYALNALPGKIPVIGKLFTAETGGGLFAVRVKISGPLTSPHIRANPLSVLAPGVLRNVFGGVPKK